MWFCWLWQSDDERFGSDKKARGPAYSRGTPDSGKIIDWIFFRDYGKLLVKPFFHTLLLVFLAGKT